VSPRPDCLVRFLERRPATALVEESLARQRTGDVEGACLFALLAQHRDEILEDLRAGGAVRELDRRDLLALRRDADRPNIGTKRWGVGMAGTRVAADGDTLPEALENFDGATLFVSHPAPARN
jgi:hypothetical protein